MIAIARFTMVGVEDRCGSSDQDSTWNEPLQMRGRLQQSCELWIAILYLHQNRLSDLIIY